MPEADRGAFRQMARRFGIPSASLIFWPDPPIDGADHGGNDLAPQPLGGAHGALTSSIAFLWADADAVMDALGRTWTGWWKRRVRKFPDGCLGDHLPVLAPSTLGQATRVLLASTERGVAMFDNVQDDLGILTLACEVARSLGVGGHVVRSVRPDRCGGFVGARQLVVLGPHDPSGVQRSVGVWQARGGRWAFDEVGAPLEMERTEAYHHPHQDERFTCDMLVEYVQAAGLRPWDEDFYGGPFHVLARSGG